MNSNLVIITGGSTSGKSTLCKKLILNNSFAQYKPFTTRNIRNNEVDLDYRHIKPKEFEFFKSQNKFLFWDKLFKSFYGVGKDFCSFINTNRYSLVILPAWRVMDLLSVVQGEPLIVHLINESLPIARQRLAERGIDDFDDRLEDLIIQNNIVIRNECRLNESNSIESIYELIIAKINNNPILLKSKINENC